MIACDECDVWYHWYVCMHELQVFCVCYLLSYSLRTCVDVEEEPEWWVCSSCHQVKKPKQTFM